MKKEAEQSACLRRGRKEKCIIRLSHLTKASKKENPFRNGGEGEHLRNMLFPEGRDVMKRLDSGKVGLSNGNFGGGHAQKMGAVLRHRKGLAQYVGSKKRNSSGDGWRGGLSSKLVKRRGEQCRQHERETLESRRRRGGGEKLVFSNWGGGGGKGEVLKGTGKGGKGKRRPSESSRRNSIEEKEGTGRRALTLRFLHLRKRGNPL